MEARSIFFAVRPALERYYDGGPCHQECGQAHGDGKDKHGIQVVLLKCSDSVFVASHKEDTTRYKTETGDQFGRRARGQVGGWRCDVEGDVCYGASDGKANEERPPLAMDQGRDLGSLMVGGHHDTQKQDDEAWERIERKLVRRGLIPLRVMFVRITVLRSEDTGV